MPRVDNDALAASKIAFVLGAGASLPLGMPTTISFQEKLCDDTADRRVAEEIRKSASYRFRIPESAVNIEDFLEHLYELQLLIWIAQRSSLPTLLPNFTATSEILGSAGGALS